MKRQDAESLCLSEPQKAHPTDEFVIVVENGGCVLLCLASSLATGQTVRLKFEFWQFLNNFIFGHL